MKALGWSACVVVLAAVGVLPQVGPAGAGPEFRVGLATDPGHLNPGVTTGAGTHVVADNIYSGLVQLDADLTPAPNLARSWTVSPDGRIHTFELAAASWHDGRAFTAEDVKFTFEEVLLRYHARTRSGLAGVLEAVEVRGRSTVVFRFSRPYAALLQRLDVVEAPILPKHVFEHQPLPDAPANRAPVGTGPFRLERHVPGELISLSGNQTYFKPGLPRLGSVSFRVYRDAEAAVEALERGDVQYVGGVPGRSAGRIRQNPELELLVAPAGPGGSGCVTTLIFNLDRSIFADAAVRRALARAIDRRRILDQVQLGYGRLAAGPISSELAWAYTGDVPGYDHDARKAAELLDAAGLPHRAAGPRATLSFVHATGFRETVDLIVDDLERVGFGIERHALPPTDANRRTFVDRDFDLGIASYCNGADPDVGVSRALLSTAVQPIPMSNGAGYRNPAMDELFERAAGALDRQARAELYHRIQRLAVEEAPYVWLVETDLLRARRRTAMELRHWAGDLLERAWLR